VHYAVYYVVYQRLNNLYETHWHISYKMSQLIAKILEKYYLSVSYHHEFERNQVSLFAIKIAYIKTP